MTFPGHSLIIPGTSIPRQAVCVPGPLTHHAVLFPAERLVILCAEHLLGEHEMWKGTHLSQKESVWQGK